jgi:hypothetical protein
MRDTHHDFTKKKKKMCSKITAKLLLQCDYNLIRGIEAIK